MAAPAAPQQKKVALVCTTIWRRSHAQHIADRFLLGYPRAGQWHRPALDLVSIFVDAPTEGTIDLAPIRTAEFPQLVQYSTIGEALRCGGSSLAVDAVLIVGEHGTYENTEHNQVMYPRYEFFCAVCDIFRADGRSVPVFNDKHLSYDWEKAHSMVEQSRELGFPFLAGSSIPCGYRMPAVDLPHGAEVEESLVIAPGGEHLLPSIDSSHHVYSACWVSLTRGLRLLRAGRRRHDPRDGNAAVHARAAQRWRGRHPISPSDAWRGLLGRNAPRRYRGSPKRRS
jgi:hypothetical protein